jgi:hypothetical protein
MRLADGSSHSRLSRVGHSVIPFGKTLAIALLRTRAAVERFNGVCHAYCHSYSTIPRLAQEDIRVRIVGQSFRDPNNVRVSAGPGK